MTVESEVYSRLVSFAGLMPLVGDRVYPGVAPQNIDPPYIVYARVSETRMEAFGGPDGLIHETRFQFDAYAEEYAEIVEIQDQIIAALHLWYDEEAATPIADCRLDSFEQGWDSATLIRHVQLDFIVSYRT